MFVPRNLTILLLEGRLDINQATLPQVTQTPLGNRTLEPRNTQFTSHAVVWGQYLHLNPSDCLLAFPAPLRWSIVMR